MNAIFGAPAIALTVFAYYQTERLRFLKINALAVTFFGLTLLVNQGVTGALVSFLSVAIYIMAIFTNDDMRKKLSYVLPVFAFAIAMQSFETKGLDGGEVGPHQWMISYLPALATFLITISALQSRMIVNKIVLLFALIIWATYSYILQAWFAMAADVVGIVTLLLSMRKLRGKEACYPH